MKLAIILLATSAGFASVLTWSCLRVGAMADQAADSLDGWRAQRDAQRAGATASTAPLIAEHPTETPC